MDMEKESEDIIAMSEKQLQFVYYHGLLRLCFQTSDD